MNAAFTWVYNDIVGLELWCKYYSRYFDDLYVICVGTKEEYNQKLDEMKDTYRLQRTRLEMTEWDAEVGNSHVKAKQVELLKDYRWVLFSDIDEIVCTDPKYYKDLTDFMKRCRKPWKWCWCYEVLQETTEPHLDMNQPILKQRTSWLKNPGNNKVLISRVPLSWNQGFHQIHETMGMCVADMPFKGLILLHLKHADYDAPNRDLIPNRRQKYTYVLDNWEARQPMPDWVREVI